MRKKAEKWMIGLTLAGVLALISGSMKDVSAYPLQEDDPQTAVQTESAEEGEKQYPAPELDLFDQYGQKHKLEDYRGKIIFLNFWATWCPPCRAEMPDIQALFEENSQEEDSDLVILGVAFPGFNQEKSEEEIEEFLYENGYTYPVLMDTGADLFYSYGLSAYPTTYMIDKEGNLFGYVVGGITRESMDDIIRQTREGKKD